jgi:hypothetical protein
MITRLIPLLIAALTASGGRCVAEPFPESLIYINVSVKLILYPGDGGRPRLDPADINSRVTDAQITASINDANSFLASYQRGYRLRVNEILTIGGLNQDHSNQPNTQPGYYAIQSTNDVPLTFVDGSVVLPLIDMLDRIARTNSTTKTTFKWNDNAVNVFVPSAWGGGGGIDPAHGNAAGFGLFEGWLFLHELGHYYYLGHTFWTDDYVSDTLIDPNTDDANATPYNPYATYYERARNRIAAANNMASYDNLPYDQQQQVDNVFFNLMSYYDAPHRNQFVTRLTEGQVDRWADIANTSRAETISGYTRFFGGPVTNGSAIYGSSANPYASPFLATLYNLYSSTPDIYIGRPGAYAGYLNVIKPVTLRATRNGAVSIGALSHPTFAIPVK